MLCTEPDVRYTIQRLPCAHDWTDTHSRQTPPYLTSRLAALGSTAGIGVLCQALLGRQHAGRFAWECLSHHIPTKKTVKLLNRLSCHFHTSAEVLGTDPVQRCQWMCGQHREALIRAVVMVWTHYPRVQMPKRLLCYEWMHEKNRCLFLQASLLKSVLDLVKLSWTLRHK